MYFTSRKALAAFLLAGMLAVGACGSNSATTPQSPAVGSGSSLGAAGSSAADTAVDGAARALLPARFRDSGTIVVGSAMNYPPEQFMKEDGTTPTGFSVDLADAMGRRLGVTFRFENTTFDAILAGIEAGRYDIAITSMSVTTERRKLVDFVTYFNTGTVITAHGGNPKNIHSMIDLCGLKLAGIKGSLNADKAQKFSDASCVPQGRKPIEIVWFSDSAATKQALAAGRIDAQFGDFSSSIYNAEHSAGTLQVVSDDVDYGDPYGIAFKKGNQELGKALEAALNGIIASGEYQRILTSWGVRKGAVDRAEYLPAG